MMAQNPSANEIPSRLPAQFTSVKACVFDVFGTLFDWRTAVVRELRELVHIASKRNSETSARLSRVDWIEFANEWRKGYNRDMKAMAAQLLPPDAFPKIDFVHRQILDSLITSHNLQGVFTESELVHVNLAWHRLDPWPDVPSGMGMLKQRYMTSPLSNGSIRLLVDLTRWSGISFDLILSAELFAAYKPNPKVYLGTARLLDLRPEEVCLIAAHRFDLEAAKKHGFATVYLRREGEEDDMPVTAPNKQIDVVVDSLEELARLAGC